jgi:hypothetical protein
LFHRNATTKQFGKKLNVFNVRGLSQRRLRPATTDASLTVRLSQLFCGNSPARRETVNQTVAAAASTRVHATFLSSCALSHTSRTRIAVVGSGNIDVGSKNPTRLTGQPMVERFADSGFPELRIDRQGSATRAAARKCGAMSEQSADSGRGNEQVPQKLLQLVGYRDPNARPEPWVRPPLIRPER